MKSNKALARKILCGLLAAGVVGVSGSALAAEYGTIYENGSKREINDNNAKASMIIADTDSVISFTGGGTVTIENAIKKPVYTVSSKGIINFGTESKQLEKLTAKVTDDTQILGLVVAGGVVNINAKTYEQSGSTLGLYVSDLETGDGATLNINVDDFKSVTKVCAIQTRDASNVSATVNAKNFYAESTYKDTATSTLHVNEGSTMTINADNVELIGSHMNGGGVIGTGSYGTLAINTNKLKIDGNINGSYGDTTDTGNTAAFIINAKTLDMKGDINIGTVGHELNGAGSNNTRNTVVTITTAEAATITGDININGNAGSKANKDDQSILNIEFNGDSQINGEINVKGSEKAKNATVNLGGTGDMTASTGKFNVENSGNVNFKGGKWAINEWTGDGTGDATIAKDAAVNVQANGMKVATLKLDGTANLVGGKANVETGEMSGSNGTVNTDSVNNQIVVGEDRTSNLAVHGTKEVTDVIASGDASLQNLADVVMKSNGKSAANTVTSDANDILGGYKADVDKNGDIITKSAKTLENPTNRAISDMANISLMTWRAENNDMNKRLGELRDSKGEHGAWARMARGESKYGSQNVKNQYNYYQVGYDEKLSTNPNWTVGVALTRTEGSSTFARGTGENKHTGFAVYGSYLNDNGSFIDLIAKYARMDNDYKTIGVGVGDASYESNGYSLSAEYGKRFTKDNGFWIEPQVELTYGTVGSVDYLTSKGARVHQDSVDSLVGRLGFSLGKDIKQGNVYVRASYLYDFDGETSATMVGKGSQKYEQDLGGGWWEVGVGTNINLSDATHLYFDVEKTYGGNVATPWQWNAGVRWSF